MKRSPQEFLPRIFLVVFLLFWMSVCVVVCTKNPLGIIIMAVFTFGVLILLGQVLEKLDRIPPVWFWFIFGVLTFLFFLSTTNFALAARIGLPSDTDIVYDSVADLLRDGQLNELNPKFDLYYPGIGLKTNSDYFCMYYNNIALLALLAGVYWIVGDTYIAGTVEGQTPALVFTALCVLLTVLLLCYIAYRITHKRSTALFTLILCIIFQPFYYGIPNFYTDVIVFPFAIGGIAALTEFYVSKRKPWLAVAGTFFSLAICIKVTAGIFVIAAGIVLLLDQLKVREKLIQLLWMGLPVLVVIVAFRIWTVQCGWFDFSRKEELAMPWQLWLCFGGRGVGYNYEDALAAATTAASQRSAMLWQRLWDTYTNYSFRDLVELEITKIAATWNDGRFETAVYTLWPAVSNWSRTFTQPQETSYQILFCFGQIYIIVLYFILALTAWKQLYNSRISSPLFFCTLSVFGFVAYLMLFETAARRALLVMPLLIIVGGCILTDSHWKKWGEKVKNG